MSTSSVGIPTMTETDGYKEWHLNGELHREDGPALECPDGTNEWYINGELHREDGPAFVGSRGDNIWFLNGERLSEEEHSSHMTLVKRAI
jgi:hypothetical protein